MVSIFATEKKRKKEGGGGGALREKGRNSLSRGKRRKEGFDLMNCAGGRGGREGERGSSSQLPI